MASHKRKADFDTCASKKRKAITMEVKVDIIRRSDKGETPTEIGRSLGLSRSTVVTIIKDKDRILEHVKGCAPMKATVITKQRSGLIIEMERLLVLWLEDKNQRRIPVSLMVIQEMARRLFETLKRQKGEGSESKEFVVRRGWFMRFKDRANFHNIKVQGEAASADEKAATEFPKALAEVFEEGGYCAQQVFNVDETGLFWKRLPNRTYIAKEEKSAPGHKVGKERLTLLLGGNAAGDYKLKPMLVYQAENPRALKGISKGQLPVIWKSNRKAWSGIVPPKISFKVLLILDNAPGHPAHLDDFNPNVKVVYLPPNTTALIQPMDQGVIATFKAFYLRRVIGNALAATGKNKDLTLKDFWKTYNILDAVNNIAYSWDEVKQTSMNGVWKKLCPQFMNDVTEVQESGTSVIKNVVDMSKIMNLEVEEEDVTELLASHGEEFSAEDLIHLEKQMIEEEEDILTTEPKRFTRQGLAGGFALIEEGLSRFEAEDPNMERYTRVARGVMDSLRCYKEILEEKKMVSFQTNLQQYFKKVERPATDPATDPVPVPSTSAAPLDSPAPVSPAPSAASSQ
ncbi:tigger transposable element-derived protein 1-like [Anomaloglossus baeobatrachus]